MGVDVQRLRALSRLSRPHRRDRRIQRQVHVQPNGVARRRVRDAAIAHARGLPQFLLSGGPLAIRRHPSRGRRVMGALRFYAQHPAPAQLLSEVVEGLRATPRRISPKFFYDQRGSELFYEICRLPEYYVTRTEMAILRACAEDVARRLGDDHVVVELGCGASDKARILLQAVRHRAYYDARGVTAAFNLNLLVRIRRELDAQVDVSGFRHEAYYNEQEGRIEMHLISRRAQSIVINGDRFAFEEGAGICTEYSYKYSDAEFRALATRAGYSCECMWSDARGLFGVYFLRIDGSRLATAKISRAAAP